MAEPRKLQAARRAVLEQAIEEAALLSQLAESKGETYDPAAAFTRRDFEFSSAEIALMVSRRLRLQEARTDTPPDCRAREARRFTRSLAGFKAAAADL